ncbi:MAG: family 10 glycosylhydrolase [Vampirovibrionales bacterium]|nr:family 10 glycosylhydrolase [Vampirovibrionales bacterium]
MKKQPMAAFGDLWRAAIALTLVFTALLLCIQGARAQDLPVLRLREFDAAQFSQIEASLKAMGKPYFVIDEDQIEGLGGGEPAPLLAPLTPALYPRTLEALLKRVADGGSLILIAPTSYPAKNALSFLAQLGFALDGAAMAPEPLSFRWIMPVSELSAQTPTLSEWGQIPAGTSLLQLAPQSGELRIAARWSNGLPAIATHGRVTLLNWPWAKSLAPRQNAAILAHQLALPATRAPQDKLASSAPAPPLAIEVASAPTVAPQASTTVYDASPVLLAANRPPASKSPAPKAAVKIAPKSSRAPASGKHSSTKAGAAKKASAAVKSPASSHVKLVPTSLARPASSSSSVASPASSPATSSPASAGGASGSPAAVSAPAAQVPSAPAPAVGKAAMKSASDDMLLNDQAMLGAPGATGAEGAPSSAVPASAPPLENVRNARLARKWADVANSRKWLDDALESSLAMDLDLPVRQIQAQMVQARYHETAAAWAARRQDLPRQESELDQARRLNALSRVMAMPSARVEARAIWLDRGMIVETRGPQGLRKLIGKLADAGINVVYLETFNAGYPLYPSQILPQNPLIENWDPLAVALEEAHKRGMELHAWVWCFAVGNTRHNALIGKSPQYAGPVLEESGLMGETLRMANGSNLPPRQTEYWLSPASRRGRDFLLSVYKEIVTRYAVDGVQLDYVRYPFQRVWEQAGYEDASRVRFAQESGVSIDRLNDASLKAFIAWKTHQVSAFVEEVSQTLRAIRPAVKLSAAVFPMTRPERILAIQQDWETWINNGWIDALNPMIYTSSRRLFEDAAARILNDARQKAFVYPGVAIFRLDADEMLGHLEAIREQGGMGSTLFACAQLDAAKQEALRLGPYKSRDAIPPHRNALGALNAEISGFSRYFSRLQNPLVAASLSPAQADGLNQTLATLSALGERFAGTAPATGDPSRAAYARSLETLNEGVRRWQTLEGAKRPYRLALFEDILTRINALSAHLSLNISQAASQPASQDRAQDAALAPIQLARP